MGKVFFSLSLSISLKIPFRLFVCWLLPFGLAVVPQDIDVGHDLDGAAQLDAQTLDERLVSQEKKSRPIDLLLGKELSKISAVRRHAEVLHHLLHAPGTNRRW